LAYTIKNRKVRFHDLGLIAYQEAWDFQTKLFQETINLKTSDHQNATTSELQNVNTLQRPNIETSNHLIFCEHPHVFTLGKSGDESNLLVPKDKLETINATYVPINRGGDITYHGPGQLVVYPIFDLENFFTDIHKFMRAMEEAVIQTLREFGIEAGRIEKLTGVWLDVSNPAKARKICAMGVKMSRWVTMHGLALNVNPDLNYFNYIVPCGIRDKAVTSMEKELGSKLDMEKVKLVLKEKLAKSFGAEI
jgi:lipoyl(octanoyl) transferase